MVSQYMKKNIYTSLLSISILGLMIAALATPWYIWDNTFSEQSFDQTLNPSSGMTTVATSATLNQTTIVYDLIGFRSIRQMSGSKAKAQSYKAHTLAEMPSVTAIFRVSTSFVLITLILSLAISVFQLIFLNDYIRNKILYLVGMSNFRIALIAASVVIVISTIIALLALLGVSTAFKLDQPVCTEGPCRDFSSSVISVLRFPQRCSENHHQAGGLMLAATSHSQPFHSPQDCSTLSQAARFLCLPFTTGAYIALQLLCCSPICGKY